MSEVCAECPVLIDCAGYALNKEVVGGFYAVVWLPWPTGRRNEAQERWRARRALISERRSRTRAKA